MSYKITLNIIPLELVDGLITAKITLEHVDGLIQSRILCTNKHYSCDRIIKSFIWIYVLTASIFVDAPASVNRRQIVDKNRWR